VIIFIALPEAKDKPTRGDPAGLLPRRCPVCRDDTIIGHAGDSVRATMIGAIASGCGAESVCRARRLHDPAPLVGTVGTLTACGADSNPASGSPPVIPPSKPAPHCKDPTRLPDPSTVRRWAQRRLLGCGFGEGRCSKTTLFADGPPSLPGIWAALPYSAFEARSP